AERVPLPHRNRRKDRGRPLGRDPGGTTERLPNGGARQRTPRKRESLTPYSLGVVLSTGAASVRRSAHGGISVSWTSVRHRYRRGAEGSGARRLARLTGRT